MLFLASFDIVFQEIPGEVTLALNLSGCTNRCPGCHSPHLREDIGEPLDESMLAALIDRYGDSITCICFMGGDGDHKEVERLAMLIRQESGGELKTGWYSGKQQLPEGCRTGCFDFIKLGPWIESLGGLDSETTNQRLYRVGNGSMTDITEVFRKKSRL